MKSHSAIIVQFIVEFSIQWCIFIVKQTKEKTYEKLICKFRRCYTESNAPFKSCVVRLFSNCQQTDSVINKKKSYPKRILTRENLDICARIKF